MYFKKCTLAGQSNSQMQTYNNKGLAPSLPPSYGAIFKEAQLRVAQIQNTMSCRRPETFCTLDLSMQIRAACVLLYGHCTPH